LYHSTLGWRVIKKKQRFGQYRDTVAETARRLAVSGTESYYTNALILLVRSTACGNLRCPKAINEYVQGEILLFVCITLKPIVE